MINLVNIFIVLLIAGLVFYVLYWLLGQVALPAPFAVVAKAVLAIIVAIYLLGLLFGYTPIPKFLVG